MTIVARLLHVVPSQGQINIPSCFTSTSLDALLVSGLDGGRAVPAVEELAERLQIPSVRRVIVPGPADVVSPADDESRPLYRLLDAVRSGREALDDTLEDAGDRAMFRERFSRFAAHVARLRPGLPVSTTTWVSSLVWNSPVGDVRIRVLALNSVLVARGFAHDESRLALGLQQMPPAAAPAAITIPLSYYPLSSAWFQDAGRFLPRLWALCGYTMPDCNHFDICASMDAVFRGVAERAAVYVVERGADHRFTLRRDV